MGSHIKNFHNHNDMMIEFIGIPGVGKTTLSHMLAKSLSVKGFHVNEPTYKINSKKKLFKKITKLLYIMKILLTAPKICIYAIHIILKTHQRSYNDFIKTVSNLLYVIAIIKANSTKKGIHILDQGFVQALWSIEYSAHQLIKPLDLKQLIEMVHSKPLLIIDLHVKHTEVLKRLHQRKTNYSRLEKYFLEALPNHIKISNEILNQLKHDISMTNIDEKKLKILSLSNDSNEQLDINTIVIDQYIQEQCLNSFRSYGKL
ncbi:AAA family ATPase [Cytobacillus sp. IB215316]|uniref:AAA family ATPase n=1 Tax=Cytobacillus sp. IB215316 TaxID=3097354 RepID=UPI002A159F19|nr:AAA family ATPase [Cytobacillus sp. IB215316]MDX8361119.1 AAA family ATPase [Cytobacillus sp. IB215316]